MNLIKSIRSVVIAVLLCSSCSDDRHELMSEIKAVEDIINVRPDSALLLIEEIQSGHITGKAEKAKLSLLQSIALDKNRIDLTNDSILQPAIRYYERKGTSDEKIRTLYYKARIYENAQDHSNALKTLIEAESMICNDTGPGILALLYSAKGRIYQQILDYGKAARNYNSAAVFNSLDSDTESYTANILREAYCLMMCSQTVEAADLISSIESQKCTLSARNLNRYYQLLISIHEKIKPEELHHDIEDYLRDVRDENLTDWMMAARVYLKIGETDRAHECLNKYQRDKNAAFHYLMAQTYESKNDLPNAVREYKDFIQLYGRIGTGILTQDTKFVEEREMHQDMHERERNRRMFLSLGIIITLLGLSLAAACIINITKRLKIRELEEENLRNQIDGLLLEREELALLENKNQEGRRIISERLRIIDQFVMSDAFNDRLFESKAQETLRAVLSDRSEFVRQNRLIFNQSAPGFISHLTEKGLTDIEIDHCCLYAIGMNGKMVTTFTNAKRHYHLGSDVRKKLGLSIHDTNISIYIRNLYNQMQD